VREYHRKKWFEEQERLKKGEDEFEVDNERRPEVSMQAVNTVLTASYAKNEVDDEVSLTTVYLKRKLRTDQIHWRGR